MRGTLGRLTKPTGTGLAPGYWIHPRRPSFHTVGTVFDCIVRSSPPKMSGEPTRRVRFGRITLVELQGGQGGGNVSLVRNAALNL